MGIEPGRRSDNASAEQFADHMKRVLEETRAALKQAAEDMARYYNAKRSPPPKFKVGDKVWLDRRNIKTTRPTMKLDDRWFGPFKVTRVLPNDAYGLALPPGFRRTHTTFNVELLRPYVPDEIPGREQPAPPAPEIDDEGQEVWEVEKVVDSKFVRGKLQYKVWWKGYDRPDPNWQPEENLEGAPDAVAEFHRTHPNAPRRISRIAWSQIPFRRYENLTEGARTLFSWEDGSSRLASSSGR